MTPAPQQPEPNERDVLSAYAEGIRSAARAVRPDEPSEPEWDAVYRNIRARLHPAAPVPPPRRGHWRTTVLVAAGAAVTAVAAAIAWVALTPTPTEKREIVGVRPPLPSVVALAPAPREVTDPLADYTVLPMATAEEVDFHRVPGSGWFPVGTDPLPSVISLATTDEVELDAPHPSWPRVTLSPGDAPVLFVAKPR
ncbi:hypothetical protein VT84_28085 [Gemmata sp. SH-PL17]|uniref:hypothetical protein n=1 Tax=Gemmata sp. SH-PL17 TaxID=1630693 RepID=UPI00078E8F52|nr:hypothetical protein [Gemmata sp. SH-PL17]AMV28295.1 hypothetical protein VT84_28085 [Gemmata sp. SH-PL17]